MQLPSAPRAGRPVQRFQVAAICYENGDQNAYLVGVAKDASLMVIFQPLEFGFGSFVGEKSEAGKGLVA